MRIKKFNDIELPKKWQLYLQELPETGMGYQVVDISTSDLIYKEVLVKNCQFINSDEQIDLSDIKEINLSNGKF